MPRAISIGALILAGTSALGTSTVAVEKVTIEGVPAALRPKDGLESAFRWVDPHGTNYLVVATRQADDPDDGTRSSYLTVVHGVCSAGTCRTLRQVKDWVEHCGEDIVLEFDPSSVTVTDLDRNGYSEVGFAYRQACKGDVSPDGLKLMLLENGTKYALRGSDKAIINGRSVGGELEVDPEFKKAPHAFLEHAQALWKRVLKTIRY